MIHYTERLDKALRRAAWAHEQQQQHRKGSDIPYIIHPVGVMMIASNVTDDEDVLIACLLHDILEDVSADIYDEAIMSGDFGERVVAIVKDVTHNGSDDWHERSNEYLRHLEQNASAEAVIVSASDKIHNLLSVLSDYEEYGEALWDRFTTKNSADQVWWYTEILRVITKRGVPALLSHTFAEQLNTLKSQLQNA